MQFADVGEDLRTTVLCFISIMFFPTLYSYVWILICITDASSQEMYHLYIFNKVVSDNIIIRKNETAYFNAAR